MSIERTTKYICDGCGKELNHWRDRYETLHVKSHNYAGHHDEWEHVYVYCEPCTKQMWQAIRAIPKIVETSKEKES